MIHTETRRQAEFTDLGCQACIATKDLKEEEVGQSLPFTREELRQTWGARALRGAGELSVPCIPAVAALSPRRGVVS